MCAALCVGEAVSFAAPLRVLGDPFPYGRIEWKTSNFRGRPEPPPPFKPVRIYPEVGFDKTTVISSAPGTERFFVGEQDGKIWSLPADRASNKRDLFLDVADLVAYLNKARGMKLSKGPLYGLTFDPDFAKNRYCYVCYVCGDGNVRGPAPDGTRVSRLKVTAADPPTVDLESEELVISWLQGGHNGGCLKFGPDGYLYISTGDGGEAFPPDGKNSGQDMTTLLAKVLRIDVRKKENGKNYAVPSDNPFVKLENARPETWCYGLRNPWKMSFDRATGDLWVGDVGWELWELVYRVNKGDNFGWSIVEGSQQVHTERQRGPTPIVPPTMEIPHTEGASITGGFVYRGQKFPELVGHYVFGDWETRRIWSAKVEDDSSKGKKLGERRELIDPTVRIVDFAEDAAGELYLLDHESGAIFGLERNVVSADAPKFPRKLSETGLFRDVAKHEPAPGVIPFSINVEQFSDGATAERFVAVPGKESIKLHAKAKAIPRSQFSRAVDWPTDSVLVKTFSLLMDDSRRGKVLRRVETQTLHYDGLDWQAYTYEWNDEQTDAVLVERNGKSRVFKKVYGERGENQLRTQTWRFASRNECLRCHNPWSEYSLAFNIPQLKRDHRYYDNTQRDMWGNSTEVARAKDQVEVFRRIGLFKDVVDPLDPFAKVDETPLVSRWGSTFKGWESIDQAARSYMHVNCGHCHRFNGGGSAYIYVQFNLPLEKTKLVGVRPVQGSFGIPNAQIVAPGEPHRSALYFRMAKTGPGHMPHLGAKLVDEQGLRLIHNWIAGMPRNADDAAKVERLIALDEAKTLAEETTQRARNQWQHARTLARRSQRESPNDEELEEGRKAIEAQEKGGPARRERERLKLAEEILASPARSLLMFQAIRDDRVTPSIRKQFIELAIRPTVDAAIRDLFEGFVPEEQRTQRLGESIDVAALLKVKGNVEAGRKLFHESTVVQCRNCHRVAKKGVEIGPDLDAIGKKYDRAKLLESILQPSLLIEPKYAVSLVETKSGQAITGVVIERTDKQITLQDAQNKRHKLATDEIDGIYPQAKSLMPDHQLRDFTAEQAADLLEYLSTLVGPPAGKK